MPSPPPYASASVLPNQEVSFFIFQYGGAHCEWSSPLNQQKSPFSTYVINIREKYDFFTEQNFFVLFFCTQINLRITVV